MNRESKEDVLISLGIAIAAAVFFGLNIDFLMRGDASTYANYVLISKFDDLTLHIGYYGLLYIVDRLLGRPLGVPLHEMLAWVNVICGALALAVSYLLARRLFGIRTVALVVVLVLLWSGRVISNATSSEIYMLQMLLVLLAMLAFVSDRPASAGLFAGLALLVSPLSAYAFLFFPVYEITRPREHRSWRPLAWMLAAGTLVYGPYLLAFGHELFWGRRGLLVISDVSRMRPAEGLRNLMLYQFKHYTAMLLFLVPATFAFRKHWRFLLLSLSVAVPHLHIILKLTSENNVFILNTDFFFASWLALGFYTLWTNARWKWLGLVPVAAHVILMLASQSVFSGRHNETYAAELRAVAKQHLVGRSAVMVTDWDVIMSTTYFGRDTATALLEDEPLSRQLYDVDKPPTGQPPLDGVEIILLDPWSAGSLRTFLSREEAVTALWQQAAVVNKARRSLGLECTEIERGTHILYRCASADSLRAPPARQ
jgi:hypothetical protein